MSRYLPEFSKKPKIQSYLPEEVVLNILPSLPPKSLIRFRCVSKTWLAHIGTPGFFSKNILNQSILTMDTSQNPNPLLIVKATDKSNNENQTYSLLSYDTLECLNQIPLDLSPLSDSEEHYNLHIVASCHGLFCLYDSLQRGDIYLWNPTTTSSSSSGLKPLPPGTPRYDKSVEPYSIGFGFDPISNDFKVLRLLNVSEEDKYYTNVEAEVYTLSTGSWRQLDSETAEGVYLDDCSDCLYFQNTACLDGFIFWWTMGVGVGEEKIVAFDFSNEVFIPITPPDLSAYPCFSQLTVLKKSIAMVVHPFGKEMNFPFVQNMDCLYPYPKLVDIPYAEATNFLDIWVLLEFGVMESWTKLIKINLCHLNRQLGLWRNGELFMENSDGQLVLYDPFTETEKNLQLDGVKESLQVVLYSQ